MSNPSRLAREHIQRMTASRTRAQHGYTLIEVLLVVAISGLILGPLFAWMILTVRQQPVQRDGMIISAQAGLLRGQFPRDVTVAGAARTYPADFGSPTYVPPAAEAATEWGTWRQPCTGGAATGGRHLVVLVSQGESRTKTIYSVAPMRDGNSVVAGRSSIWRTQCAANTGVLMSQTQVVEDVAPGESETNASCTPVAPAAPADECRQVAIRVTQRDSTGNDQPSPVELNATRRTDLASLGASPTGNFLPTPIITVVSQTWNGTGSPQVTVRLSATDSRDPDGAADGSDLSFRWELPQGPEGSGLSFTISESATPTVELPAVGEYWVRLTVTDARGAVNYAYRRFEVVNRSPIAVADVSPLTVTSGLDTISMSATGSSDPDDAIVGYRWRVYSALEAMAGLEQTYVTPTADFDVPAGIVGNLVVELTVTDSLGATSAQSRNVTVIDPAAPPEVPTEPEPEPEPEPGAPVARFVATRVSGTTYSFDATDSDGAGLTYSWAFGLLAGTGTGAQVQYTYPAPGTYTATLTVTDDQDRTARRTLEVVVPGSPAAPTNVRVQNNVLMWDARPGTRRYLVDLEASNNGCARSVLNQPVAASAAPQRALPPNPCTGTGTTARARVGVEAAAGGPIAWSGWVDVPVVVK